MITRKFKREIKKDIQRIDEIRSNNLNGKCLYEELVAKYSSFDNNFTEGLPPRTVETINVIPNHHNNLVAIKGKLEFFLNNNSKSRLGKKCVFLSALATILTSVIASGIWYLIQNMIENHG